MPTFEERVELTLAVMNERTQIMAEQQDAMAEKLSQVSDDVVAIKAKDYDSSIAALTLTQQQHGERLAGAEAKVGIVGAVAGVLGGFLAFLTGGGHNA